MFVDALLSYLVFFWPLPGMFSVCQKTMYNVFIIYTCPRDQSAVYLTPLALDYLSGPLDAPSNFSVNISTCPWEGAVWITGDGPTSIYGDIGTQGVIEYIRRVSDIKREWSTPGE